MFNTTVSGWTELETEGTPPCARYKHGTCLVPERRGAARMLIFGGQACVPHATCHMPRASCHMPHAPHATCHMPHASFHMPHATCLMPHVHAHEHAHVHATCHVPHVCMYAQDEEGSALNDQYVLNLSPDAPKKW